MYGIHHLACDFKHLRDILQHSCSCPFSSYFLHGTAEVQVDEIGACLFNDLRSLHHRLYVTAVDLYAYRTLFVADGEFRDGRLHVTNQGLGAHELGIDHRRSEPLAQQPETDVRHVFHRCEEHGALTKVNVTYLHYVRKDS